MGQKAPPSRVGARDVQNYMTFKIYGCSGLIYCSLAHGESSITIFLSVLLQPKVGTNAAKFGVFPYFSPQVGWIGVILKGSRMLDNFKSPAYRDVTF